ncbi:MULTISPECIES: AAA family ATPase [unclassified Sphingomonas]|uniref:AAA family ATPase n=1 Tax=Sphingomonas TaxID=13687 RepID=UPI0009683579|nr:MULTISPECIES: AAA family ATPase [unclassified Sphingomonas]MBN8813161.1 AAA family ATPase [Sphingomonas sp.]OJY53508.1 MAG: DNA polymerase III subunit delta' [Sphingomonas sp. 67-41]
MALIGNESAHEALAAAMRNGNLHHAWLIAGPEGVGKGMFARAAALRMLAEAAGRDRLAPGWTVPPESQTAHLIEAGAHPDYRELVRLPKDPDKPDEALARSITIAQVRSLQALFATKPSFSPRRVIVIDAIDDLERGGANALLKNLEEPPAGTIFLLVSHAPGRLLPTIRSRCRLLRFEALDDGDVAAILRDQLPDATTGEIAALIKAGEGSPGRALGFAGLDIASIESEMAALADTGDPSNLIRARLAKLLGAKAAQPRYEAFLERAPSFIAERAKSLSGDALRTALDAYAAARELSGAAAGLSLDASATVFEMGGILARLRRI